jgi:hypothetical protein
MNLQVLLDDAKSLWSSYENISVYCQVIQERSELPRWEDCGKRELYIGVLQRSVGDIVYVIKHRFEAEYEFKCSVEDLDLVEDWFVMVGPFANHTCVSCGEQSSNINMYEMCLDCSKKNITN